MPSPFPGMDPYLEHPELWPDVHNRLIATIADELSSLVRPLYYVALEERVYIDEPPELLLVGRPDLTVVSIQASAEAPHPVGGARRVLEVELPAALPVRETYLEVRGVTEGDVVTAIELLSPANKRPGTGRRLYVEKRAVTLATWTSLVEIDLLRGGEPMPMVGPRVESDYRIVVARAWRRPKAELIAVGLRDPLPAVSIPLRRDDPEPRIDLGHLLHALYDRAAYDLRIDYERAPVPPLAVGDVPWAAERIAEARPHAP